MSAIFLHVEVKHKLQVQVERFYRIFFDLS